METQKIVNLGNSSENEFSKLTTKTWYVIDSESKGNYSLYGSMKFLTVNRIKSLWLFWYIYILVTGDIAVTRTIAANAVANPPVQKRKNNHSMQLQK